MITKLYVHPIFKAMGRVVRLVPVKNKECGNYVIFRSDLTTHVLTEFESHYCAEYDFSLLTPERVGELSRFELSQDHYAKRLANNHIAMVAKQAGEIHAFAWVRFDRTTYSYDRNEREIPLFKLGPKEAYLYDLYVLPEHRFGTGYFLAMKLMELLRGRGHTHLYSLVNFNTRFSLTNSIKIGARLVGVEHIYRIGPFKWHITGLNSEFKKVEKQLSADARDRS